MSTIRLVLWLSGGALALLFLIGVVNVAAPGALGRISVAPPSPTPPVAPSQPRAAIIDQTGYSFPSPDFIAQATTYLEEAGYTVTYYPPKEVTVSFYRGLPDQGYEFILFQTHSTSQVVSRDGAGGQSDLSPGPFLFTTELYERQRYIPLQMSDQVRASQLFYEDAPELFAIGPSFVRRSMGGFFPDTVIVIGGCQSLAAPDLARAFLEKGASAVIGWDDMVDLSHNNRSMLHLLEAMLVDGAPPAKAVETTMAAVGPDPRFESSLDVME